jgi:hypothetical protein
MEISNQNGDGRLRLTDTMLAGISLAITLTTTVMIIMTIIVRP